MKKLFILLSFLSAGAFAQPWSLQKCIDHALKNNLALKQSELTTEMNKVNLTQSKANILPSLNAGANHTYNIGRTIDRYTNTFANSTVLSENFYAQAQLTLWSGMTQYNNIKKNQYTYLAGVETLEQQKNDLALNVATAFLQVIYNTELLKVAEQQVNISKLQLERTQKLADAGSLAMSNVYDIKATLANDEYTYTTANNNYNLALLSLKQLLYLDTLNTFSIEKPEFDLTASDLAAYNPQDIYQTALKTQHKIKSAEYTMMSAEKNLSFARGRVSPTINFTGTLGTGYSGLAKDVIGVNYTGNQISGFTSGNDTVYTPVFNPITRPTPWSTQFSNNVNKSIGFSLNIPIFNGLQNYSSIKNAKLQVLNNKYGYDLARQQLYKTIAQAYADAQGSLNKYASAKTALEASQQSFTYAEQKFNAGALNSFDYNNSKNRVIKATADMLNSKYDFIFKLKVLDYYQGKPLTF
ncbi:MAG: TolC family protein [Bacteroidia bacterium]